MKIDKRAIVSPGAVLGKNVEIGPYSIIGDNVKIGDNTVIGSFVSVDGWTDIGSSCKIFNGAVIGSIPQDLKYKGDKSYVFIGNQNIIREYVTINRSSFLEDSTVVGNNVSLLSYVHIAHDCKIGNDVIIANSAGLSGHVKVGDKAVVGGFVGVHQFVRIGKMSMVGGYTKLVQDVVPFMLVDGQPTTVYSINFEGLRRHKISSQVRKELKVVNKILFRSNLNVSQAIDKIKAEIKPGKEINELLAFLEEDSRQGILVKVRADLECSKDPEKNGYNSIYS